MVSQSYRLSALVDFKSGGEFLGGLAPKTGRASSPTSLAPLEKNTAVARKVPKSSLPSAAPAVRRRGPADEVRGPGTPSMRAARRNKRALGRCSRRELLRHVR